MFLCPGNVFDDGRVDCEVGERRERAELGREVERERGTVTALNLPLLIA